MKKFIQKLVIMTTMLCLFGVVEANAQQVLTAEQQAKELKQQQKAAKQYDSQEADGDHGQGIEARAPVKQPHEGRSIPTSVFFVLDRTGALPL